MIVFSYTTCLASGASSPSRTTWHLSPAPGTCCPVLHSSRSPIRDPIPAEEENGGKICKRAKSKIFTVADGIFMPNRDSGCDVTVAVSGTTPIGIEVILCPAGSMLIIQASHASFSYGGGGGAFLFLYKSVPIYKKRWISSFRYSKESHSEPWEQVVGVIPDFVRDFA